MTLFCHIGLNARRSNAESWGDHPYALCLARALGALGHRARLFYRDEHPPLTGAQDCVIRIVGPHLDEPVPGVPNLLWMISPPNLSPLATLRRYQKVFIASALLAERYAALGLDVACLPQATDGAQFNPGAGGAAGLRFDVAFVGNLAPRAPRHNVRRAIALGFGVTVWGEGWQGVVPDSHIGGTRLDTGQLAAVYAGSRVVLNSHMPAMAAMGFMSNRSFDAMACGAHVLSDRVAGFDDSSLPGLIMAQSEQDMVAALDRLLAGRGAAQADRAAIAASVRDAYGFRARARVLAEEASRLLSSGQRAVPAVQVHPPRKAAGVPRALHLQDVPATLETPPLDAVLDRHLAGSALDITLALQDPSTVPEGMGPADAMRRAAAAVLRIGAVLAREPALARLRVEPPEPDRQTGVIHAVMADHRRAQAIALAPRTAHALAELETLCARARRMLEFAPGERHPLVQGAGHLDRVQLQIRLLGNRPLYAHTPEGFSRDKDKRHLLLWPRSTPVTPPCPVGVFLHLYHAELAPVFRDRLAALGGRHRLYVSTDTADKADRIRADLPEAMVRILPNRGRDVFPKVFGFAKDHAAHEVVLHLHGKKSSHSGKLDQWLEHCLDCLLPGPAEVARILSLFGAVPALGLVAPLTYPAVLGAAHWGDNRDIARELMVRMGLGTVPLPGDAEVTFPVGSMFWARTAALRPLLDLGLGAEHFPPETGQLDATPAHAIERLFGVVCAQTGHRLIRVAPPGSRLHKAYQLSARTNAEVRAALAKGEI